jgi:hypothetical protein
MVNEGNPQLLVGPNDSSSLITSLSEFTVDRVNLVGSISGIALSITGNTNATGNIFLGVTSGNSLGVSNVPANLGTTGNIIIGATGYFMNSVNTNDITIHNIFYMGSPNSIGSFKFERSPSNGYLRIFKWNTQLNIYELSLRLEHFC